MWLFKESVEQAVKKIVKTNVESLIDVGSVGVTTTMADKFITVHLTVDKTELGKVIGKNGKTAAALSTLLTCCAAKHDMRAYLDIVK